jgi:hypothetical protein
MHANEQFAGFQGRQGNGVEPRDDAALILMNAKGGKCGLHGH